MIKVNLQEISPTAAFDTVVEMAAVPRIGDSIAMNIDCAALMVRSVTWTPNNSNYDVQVCFR